MSAAVASPSIPPAYAVETGREVEVGIRPEDLRLAGNGEGALTFTKDFAEELGATRLFHGMVGDAAVVVALSGAAPAGDKFGLSATPEAVHLFDPASGNSLRRRDTNVGWVERQR